MDSPIYLILKSSFKFEPPAGHDQNLPPPPASQAMLARLAGRPSSSLPAIALAKAGLQRRGKNRATCEEIVDCQTGQDAPRDPHP